ncbi:MAG TPA: hypothetical protein PKW95_18855 [bacterium]|nr:hypothetical protein [bacterium]
MKRVINLKECGQQGMVMLIVLMVLMAVSMLSMASMLVVGTDLKISGHYKRSAQAFWAAEAGVQKALGELRDNRDFVGDLGSDSLSNDATFSVEVVELSSFLKRVIATGRIGSSVKRLEVIVNVDSAFESAINAGGDVILDGKPRISSEGVRVNGNAYLNLDAGTPELNLYMPSSSTLTVDGDTTDLHRLEKEAMDLAAIKLTDEQWYEIAQTANRNSYYDNDGQFGTADTSVTISDLDFDDIPEGPDGHRTIFVDGDVYINGQLSGIGTIVASGKIICEGDFRANPSTTPTVSMIAKDDVLLNFDTEAMSMLNGLVYTEGDYELHGKIKYWGVVTAFGSVTIQNPSEFTNNNSANYWYTYSSAYNVISDPVDILSWTEMTQ